MAFLDINFDDLPESTSSVEFQPLPVGWYSATINKAEVKNTKDGTGQYISVRYDITGPTHQGRVVFGNINIKNKSEQAEGIGRKHLNEIRLSLGIGHLTDTDQLIGGSLQIKLEIKTDEQYGTKNEVKGFKASADAMPISAEIPSFPKPAASKSEGAAPPWAKK